MVVSFILAVVSASRWPPQIVIRYSTGAALALNPFIDWLPEVTADPVVVCPNDIGAEARGNLWSFSLSANQAAAVCVADVIRFAGQVAEARRAWLATHKVGQMVLYWWHDDQAGQLRFSLVSAVHARLPFGCKLVAAKNLDSIVQQWLGSPHSHFIPWSDLQRLAVGEAEPPVPPLSVWSQTLL